MALGVSAALIVAVYLLRRPIARALDARASASTLPLAVAASRLELGVHWPTDVVAGLSLGATVALVTVAIGVWTAGLPARRSPPRSRHRPPVASPRLGAGGPDAASSTSDAPRNGHDGGGRRAGPGRLRLRRLEDRAHHDHDRRRPEPPRPVDEHARRRAGSSRRRSRRCRASRSPSRRRSRARAACCGRPSTCTKPPTRSRASRCRARPTAPDCVGPTLVVNPGDHIEIEREEQPRRGDELPHPRVAHVADRHLRQRAAGDAGQLRTTR